MRKIHYTQMEASELYEATDRSVCFDYRLCPHSLDRMQEKHIGFSIDKFNTNMGQEKFRLIEYKTDGEKERVVVRMPWVPNRDLCAVLCLTEKVIVTVWANSVDDAHLTLDLSVYDENLKILQ